MKDAYGILSTRQILIRHPSPYQINIKTTQNILNQEQKFNELFFELENQINHLRIKGTPQKQGYTFTPGVGPSYVPNPDFIPEYENVAIAAGKLQTTIKKARKAFFNNPPTEISLKQFHDTVCEAIEEARPIFAIVLNVWDQLHPVLKGLPGVIAAITIIPAIVIEIISPRGFIGTFFKTQQPDSLVKLESFEKEVCGNNGVFDEIENAIKLC